MKIHYLKHVAVWFTALQHALYKNESYLTFFFFRTPKHYGVKWNRRANYLFSMRLGMLPFAAPWDWCKWALGACSHYITATHYKLVMSTLRDVLPCATLHCNLENMTCLIFLAFFFLMFVSVLQCCGVYSNAWKHIICMLWFVARPVELTGKCSILKCKKLRMRTALQCTLKIANKTQLRHKRTSVNGPKG